MAKKLKAIRKIVTEKDILDVSQWTIKKGTTLFVMNEDAPVHPRFGYRLILVRVDNGTGELELCQETCVKDIDLYNY